MKKIAKRIGMGFVAAAMLFLTACGGGGKADTNTLKISVDKGYIEYVTQIKDKFEADNDIKIELIEADMFETLEALSLDGPAGTAPDVMMSAYDRMGVLGQQGHIAEVTINDADYDATDKLQVTSGGKIYGSPAIIETLVFYFNKDNLDKAPTTFEELEALAKDEKYAFESEAGKNTAFLAKWTDFYFTYGLLSGYGGYVFGDNGQNPEDIGLNNKGSVEGITYATKWFQEVWPKGMQDNKSNENFITDSFVSGKTAAIIGGPWQAQSLTDAGVNFGVAKIPTLPNGQEYKPFAGGKGWVVNNYSEQKEVGQKWLDYVSTQENQELLYELTQEIPANQKARATAKAQDNELTKAVIAQYESAVPMPNIPQMSEVWTGAENLMFDAGSGSKTPQEAADIAVNIIKDAIREKHSA